MFPNTFEASIKKEELRLTLNSVFLNQCLMTFDGKVVFMAISFIACSLGELLMSKYCLSTLSWSSLMRVRALFSPPIYETGVTNVINTRQKLKRNVTFYRLRKIETAFNWWDFLLVQKSWLFIIRKWYFVTFTQVHWIIQVIAFKWYKPKN